MSLGHCFHAVILARLRADPAFRAALLQEAAQNLRAGEVDIALTQILDVLSVAVGPVRMALYGPEADTISIRLETGRDEYDGSEEVSPDLTLDYSIQGQVMGADIVGIKQISAERWVEIVEVISAAAGSPGTVSLAEMKARLSPESRANVDRKALEIKAILAKFDPEKHRHDLRLDGEIEGADGARN